ncbi:MAG: choice-of-anchor Q domain-containing protein, partial [Caldilineaceae bacterium]
MITLRNVNVVSGTAIYGGGIYNAGTLHLSNANLNDNVASSNGGAIYNIGDLRMIENVTLQGNRANRGGALYNGGNLNLTGLTLQENSASEGGALYNTGALTLTALVLQNNSATNSGGAFYNAGSTTVLTTTFASNRATDGTLYNAGNLVVTASTFAANLVTRGGGLYNTTGYTASVINSSFANNSAGEGGGIHNRGVLTVTNSSIANNGGYGSSLHNWNGTLYLRNSLLAGSCVNQGTLATNRNNLIESGNCNPAYTGPANLAALGNYGGNSQTFALLAGSPAIDHADPIYCPTVDQRGLARVGTCDIGAFESQGFQMLYAGGSDQAVDAGLAFVQPLQISVTANANNEPVGGSINLVAPSEGAGLNLTSNQVTVNSSGLASLTVTANRLTGSYVVTATANGVTSTAPITFALSNQPCVGTVVSNANDSGAGSLRNAINQVCPGGTITFTNDFTIRLHSTLLISDTASNPVTIDGAGHKIIISGDSNGDGTPDLQPLVIGASKSVTLTHLQVLSGTATSGSAIYNGGTLVLDTVTLAHHVASSNDSNNNGTLYNVGTLTVRNSTFAHNESYRGGGIYNRSGTAVVSNSTFAENVAPEGGGIFNHSVLTVTNSTFADNTTDFGEGIYNSGSLYLINSLLKGKSSVAPNCSGNAAILRLNNLSDDSSCGSASRSNRVRLLSLADQGGTATGSESNVETAALSTGSSAIDAGNAAYCSDLDQRGKPRLGNCDVGAVEWQGYQLASNNGDEQHAGILNDFAQPLQVTLNALESGDSVPSGSVITFSAPISGASLSNSSLTAATDGSQRANLSVTANDVIGTYLVTATSRYVTTPVTFTLRNECGLATVHNDHDSGSGSLRQAIIDTCDSGVISFDGDYSIYLKSTLSISKTITVDGAGHTVVLSGDTGNDGSPDLRVLAIDAGGAVTLSHLSIVSGTVSGEDGAGIMNEGELTLLASTLAGHA